MGYALLKKQLHSLFEQVPFVNHIKNKKEYEKALKLMDELIEDYDYNRTLIGILAISIETWENESEDFREFNERIKSLKSDSAVLRVFMSQFNLGIADFPEIGSKSLISKIINNERRLTLDHIKSLCKRFHITPSIFIDRT